MLKEQEERAALMRSPRPAADLLLLVRSGGGLGVHGGSCWEGVGEGEREQEREGEAEAEAEAEAAEDTLAEKHSCHERATYIYIYI